MPKYAFVTIISLASFLLLSIYLQKDKAFRIQNIFYLFCLFYLFAGSSIIWSEYPGTYYFEFINLSCLLLLLFVSLQINQFNNIKLILNATVISGTAVVFVFFIQLWGWNPLSYVIQGFPAASFINKNHLANYIDLLIPICFSLLITSNNKKLKWLYAFCLSLLFSFIITSHTRASWLSLFIILVILLFFARKFPFIKTTFQNQPFIIVLFIILASFALSLSAPSTVNETNRFTSLYSYSSSNTISQRTQAYKNALNMIKDNPVTGVGLGSFYISYKPYHFKNTENKSTFLQLHNDPLQVFVELGIVGGILYIAICILIIYLPYKKLSTASNIAPEKKIIYLSLLLALISSGIHSLFSFPLHLPATSFLSVVIIGILFSVFSKRIKTNKFIYVLFAAVFIFTSSLTVPHYTKHLYASYKLNNAIKSIHIMSDTNIPTSLKNFPLDRHDCSTAKTHTDNALNLYGSNFYIHGWSLSIYGSCVANSDEKIALADKILKHDPYHFQTLEMMVSTYFNDSRYDQALKHLNSLHVLQPGNSNYVLWLGHIASRKKNYHNAIKYYQKVLILDPGNQAASEMIIKLKNKN